MKKFIKYLLALFLTSVLLLYLLDFIYTYAYVNGTPRNKVSYVLSHSNLKINYVFIGSSRVDNNIDAEVIESITGKKAINLGQQGGKIDDFLLILKLLDKQNITADTIFIQIDYIYNIEGNSEILKSSLMPFIHDDLIYGYIKKRDQDYRALKYLPFYRYLIYDYKIGFREFFNTAVGKESWITLENGFFPLKGSSGKRLSGNLPDHILEENRQIEAINSFANENGINIVYFIAPYCSGTRNLDFALKLQNKLPEFYNFSTIFLENEEYFYDCSHLNNMGAKEFSRIFAEKIITTKSNCLGR